jgi:hypothetical protein
VSVIFNSHGATLLGDPVRDRMLGRDQGVIHPEGAGRSISAYPLAGLHLATMKRWDAGT